MEPGPVTLWSSVSSLIKWGERKSPLNNFFQLLSFVVWINASLLISQQHRELTVPWTGGWYSQFHWANGPFQASLFPSLLRGKQLQALVPLLPAQLPYSSLLSLRVGPLVALLAAHSATVPVRASFPTARASTASALRSSSDEDPKPLPSGEQPAPRAHTSSSLRGLRTPFSRLLRPQMGCLAPWPENQQWRTWFLAE